MLLILAIGKSQADLLGAARKQATIDSSRAALEREVAERQRTERLLSLQYVITRVLAGSGNLVEAAPFILRIMGENQGWQVGELWEVRRGAGSSCAASTSGTPRASGGRSSWSARRAVRVKSDEGLPGRVWQRHLPLWIPDLAEEPTLPMAGFSRRVGAARRLRHPAAQRPRGDRRDGVLRRARSARPTTTTCRC